MIYILNGPNLNRLGTRQPEIYGSLTLEDIKNACESISTSLGYQIDFRQTNHEGELINWVHEAENNAKGLIINAAGYTHTSVALLDALLILKIPIIEVHLTVPLQRENFRHTSFVTPAATGMIAGFSQNSYILAIRALVNILESNI